MVVGGGAAGVTAAYFAAQNSPNAKVTVLERTREAGKKVIKCSVADLLMCDLGLSLLGSHL